MSNGILRISYDASTEFCSLIHPHSQRFLNFVRYSVLPMSYRRFDEKSHRWEVHISKLALVVLFGKSHFDHVDYRSLPPGLQIKLVAEMAAKAATQDALQGRASREQADPYSVLHLLPSAPWEVIKAAYKALAGLHHPDHGGSPEAFRIIQESYEELEKKCQLDKKS